MSDYLDQYASQIDVEAISELRSSFHQKNLSNQWLQEWSSLKKNITDLKTDFLESFGPRVQVGNADALDASQLNSLTKACEHLIPWRKGPYDVFGLSIDAEWDSSIKWSRLKPHLNVRGKKICDIGSNNGYFMWKLLESNPELVVGLEPVAKHWACFEMFKGFLKKEVPAFMEPIGVEYLSLYPKFFDIILCFIIGGFS